MEKQEKEFIDATSKIFSNDFIFFLQVMRKSIREEEEISKDIERIAKKIAQALEGSNISCCLAALTFHITSIIASDSELIGLLNKISDASGKIDQKEKIDGYIR